MPSMLIQNRRKVVRCAVDDVDQLQRLLELFFGYERPEIAEFRKAVEQFKVDLPAVCEALRGMVEKAYADNATFRAAADKSLKQARNHQPIAGRGGRPRNSDPAHRHRGYFRAGVPRFQLPRRQQHRARAVQASTPTASPTTRTR